MNSKTKRILIFTGVAVFVILFIIGFFAQKDEEKQNRINIETQSKNRIIDSIKAMNSIDSVIKIIKSDKSYKIENVEFTKDSVLKISVGDAEESGTDYYFIKNYNLEKMDIISEVSIYMKNKFLYGRGKHSGLVIKRFKQNFVKSDGSIIPVVEYLEKNMNDPNSFEHIKTEYNLGNDGNFNVEMKFRGRNTFGGLVINSLSAKVSQAGDVFDVKMN